MISISAPHSLNDPTVAPVGCVAGFQETHTQRAAHVPNTLCEISISFDAIRKRTKERTHPSDVIFSVAFCSPAKSLTFGGLMENPLDGKKLKSQHPSKMHQSFIHMFVI